MAVVTNQDATSAAKSALIAKITAAGGSVSTEQAAGATPAQLQDYLTALTTTTTTPTATDTTTTTTTGSGVASSNIAKAGSVYAYNASLIKGDAAKHAGQMSKNNIKGPSWVKGAKTSSDAAAYARALANQTIKSSNGASVNAAIKKARQWYTGQTAGSSKGKKATYVKGSPKSILLGGGTTGSSGGGSSKNVNSALIVKGEKVNKKPGPKPVTPVVPTPLVKPGRGGVVAKTSTPAAPSESVASTPAAKSTPKVTTSGRKELSNPTKTSKVVSSRRRESLPTGNPGRGTSPTVPPKKGKPTAKQTAFTRTGRKASTQVGNKVTNPSGDPGSTEYAKGVKAVVTKVEKNRTADRTAAAGSRATKAKSRTLQANNDAATNAAAKAAKAAGDFLSSQAQASTDAAKHVGNIIANSPQMTGPAPKPNLGATAQVAKVAKDLAQYGYAAPRPKVRVPKIVKTPAEKKNKMPGAGR